MTPSRLTTRTLILRNPIQVCVVGCGDDGDGDGGPLLGGEFVMKKLF